MLTREKTLRNLAPEEGGRGVYLRGRIIEQVRYTNM